MDLHKNLPSLNELQTRLNVLLERDSDFYGVVLQRTVFRRQDSGTINGLTVFRLQHSVDQRKESETQDYGEFIFIREEIDRQELQNRLREIGTGVLRAGKYEGKIGTPLCGSEKFLGGGNTYGGWPGTLFELNGQQSVSLASGPLLHGNLPFHDDAYTAVQQFLDLNPFHRDYDSRRGGILLFAPSYRARIEKLQLKTTQLFVRIFSTTEPARTKLHVSFSDGTKSGTKSVQASPAQTALLDFAPTYIKLWLFSEEFGLLDRYEETPYYGSENQPTLLPKASRPATFDDLVSSSAPADSTRDGTANEISVITRDGILEEVRTTGIVWFGKRDEVDFLGRLFDLHSLPSNDRRFDNMARDIWHHRINNPQDWPDDWFRTDARLNLTDGPDEVFLSFLCETLHPLVRNDDTEITTLLEIFNKHLRVDGWEIAEKTKISGRPIYAAQKCVLNTPASVEAAKVLAAQLKAEYVTQQINRMEAAIDKDVELAIGTAKEFIETICKGILRHRKIAAPIDDFPALVRLTVKHLKIVPDGLDEKSEAEKTIRILVNNLSSIGTSLAELRNPYGTGHGKGLDHKGLEEHHARLAVGLATTVGVFLFQAHLKSF